MPRPTGISTVGDLRRAIADGAVPCRDVHQEVRDNLIRKLRSGEPLFPGIVGYDETVVPQLVNALLSQHNFTARPDLRRVPCAPGGRGRQDAHRVARTRRAVCREARDA